MSYLNALITDLRDRKLWPIPLALLVALVAIPVLLSKSPAPPTSSGPSLGLGVSSTQSGPVVTDAAAPVQVPLAGGGRDPFIQQKLGGAKVVMSAHPGSGATVTVSSSGATNAGGASAGAVTVSSGSTGASTATGSTAGNGYYGGATAGSTPSTPSTPAKPAAPVTGLIADEAYQVQIALPTADGGFVNSVFGRDAELPSANTPQLVELGVKQGGGQVMFAVLPNTLVSGGGSCLPGPLDCEILAVAPNDTVDVAVRTAGAPKSLGSFTLTDIGVARLSSATAANKARKAADARGQQLLVHSGLSALALFPYNPSLGVVVDERNIQVGGN